MKRLPGIYSYRLLFGFMSHAGIGKKIADHSLHLLRSLGGTRDELQFLLIQFLLAPPAQKLYIRRHVSQGLLKVVADGVGKLLQVLIGSLKRLLHSFALRDVVSNADHANHFIRGIKPGRFRNEECPGTVHPLIGHTQLGFFSLTRLHDQFVQLTYRSAGVPRPHRLVGLAHDFFPPPAKHCKTRVIGERIPALAVFDVYGVDRAFHDGAQNVFGFLELRHIPH